jgi:hypothetical protein
MNLREKIRAFVTIEVEEGEKVKKLPLKSLCALSVHPIQSIEGLNKDAAIKLFEKRRDEIKALESQIVDFTLDYDEDRLGIRKKYFEKVNTSDTEKFKQAQEDLKTNEPNKTKWKATIEKLSDSKKPEEIKERAETKKKLDNAKKLHYGEEYYIKRLDESTIGRLFNKNKPFCPSEDNIKLLKKVIGNGLFTEFDEEVEASIEKSICNSKTCEVMDCLGPALTIYLSKYRDKSLGAFSTEPDIPHDIRHEAKIDLCKFCFEQNKDSVLKKDYATLFKQALEDYDRHWLSQCMGIDPSKTTRIQNNSDDFKVIDKSTSIKIHRLLVGASEEAMLLHIRNAFNDSQKDPSCIKHLIEEAFPSQEYFEYDDDGKVVDESQDGFISMPANWRDEHQNWLHAYVEEELGPKLITESESVEQELIYHLGNYEVSAVIDYPLEFEYAYANINKDGEGSITVAVELTAYFDFATEDEEPPSLSFCDFFEYSHVHCVLERTIDFKNPKEFKLRVLNKTTY